MTKFLNTAAGADVLGVLLAGPMTAILWGYFAAWYEVIAVVVLDTRIHWSHLEVFGEQAVDAHALIVALCWLAAGVAAIAAGFVVLVKLHGATLATCALGVYWRQSWAAATVRRTIEVEPEPAPARGGAHRVKVRS